MRRPDSLDLLLVTLGSLVALAFAALQAPVAVRLPVGLLAALILPGYSISMALLPRGEVDGVERSALAFSLSLGTIVVVAPFLGLSPVGLSPGVLVAAMSGITLVATGIAEWRRRRRPATGEPLGIALPDGRPWQWPGRHPAQAGLALVAVLVAAWIALGIVARPRDSTEFFMSGPGGTADPLPARVTAGAPVAITVGISNGETAAQPYRIRIESGSGLFTETGQILVDAGRTWTGNLVFSMTAPGSDQEIRILLLRDSSPQPYRALRLVLDVLAPT